MNRKRLYRRITFITVLFVLISLSGVAARQVMQIRLNKRLVEAIKDHDPEKVKTYLALGADPNALVPWEPAPWERKDNPSLWQRVLMFLGMQDSGTHAETMPAPVFTILWSNRGSCLGTFIRFDEADIVKSLIEAGADPNARTKEGVTVLMLVAGAYDDTNTLLPFLIAQGADVNAKTFGGWTAKKYAQMGGIGGMGDATNLATLQRAGAK